MDVEKRQGDGTKAPPSRNERGITSGGKKNLNEYT